MTPAYLGVLINILQVQLFIVGLIHGWNVFLLHAVASKRKRYLYDMLDYVYIAWTWLRAKQSLDDLIKMSYLSESLTELTSEC